MQHKTSLKSAQKRAQRLEDRVSLAVQEGKTKRTRYLMRCYLRSSDARFLAVTRANNRQRPWRRTKKSALPTIAQALEPWQGTDEKVLVTARPKDSSGVHKGWRFTMDFGIRHRSLQQLVIPLLKLQANLHPCQFGTVGTHAAIKAAAEAMRAGYTFGIEIDIKDCFPSFDGNELKKLLLLPEEVTERVLTSGHFNLVLSNYRDSYGPANEETDDDSKPLFESELAHARFGIPQGSAASAVLVEMMLARIFHDIQLPVDDVVLIAYCDNILVLGRTLKDAVSMTDTLRGQIKSNPAGHFRPSTKTLIGKPRVDFLGHRLIPLDGEVNIAPTPRNLKKFDVRLQRHLAAIAKPNGGKKKGQTPQQRAERFVRGWSDAFVLWDEVGIHRNAALQMIIETAEKAKAGCQ